MNDISLPGSSKIESLNRHEFGLRNKNRKVHLAEDPSRCMKAMYKAVEKHLNPREGLKQRSRQTFL